ncbi:hypothetical protein [Mangrovicella endophytica]|uniref:hypothetical protein n=1 Tax=Mangrovicella endophytica TaxID=2066697 RepID=UPI000C9DEE5E|nr:hypothetical protein [Mangrovicella endophytica]
MKRVASTFALSVAVGLAATSAAMLAAAAFAPHSIVSIAEADLSLDPRPMLSLFASLYGGEAITTAAVLCAFSIATAVAIGFLNSGRRLRRSQGEHLAAAALTGIATFYGAAVVAGSPVASIFGDGPAFLFSLAFCFAVLLFDHCVSVEEDPAAEAAFRAAMAALTDEIRRKERADGSESERRRRHNR